MRFTFGNKKVVDPDGGVHYNPRRVVRYHNNLTKDHTPYLWGLSLVLFGVALYFGYREVQFEGTAIKADAVVARVESRESTSKKKGRTVQSVTYRRVFTFHDPAGNSHEIAEGSWSGSRPSEGVRATVLYNPEDPSSAVVDSPMERFLYPIIFGVFGIITFIMGIVASFSKGKSSYLNIDGKTWENDTGQPLGRVSESRTSISFFKK